MCSVVSSDVGGSGVSLFGDITNNFKLEYDPSVEEDTKRIFRLGDIHVLSDLKTMGHQFGMKLYFVTVRSGRWISCNRKTRYGNRKPYGIRNVASISCECDWDIRFKFLDSTKYTLSDIVKILHVCGLHTNTCDTAFSDQYVVARINSGEYKNIPILLYKKLSIKCLLTRNLMLEL